MRKRQAGQAFILVLILLAIGVTLIVPSLNLASTSLKNSQIAVDKTRALYAASAGQEWVLWSLTQPDFTNQLPEGEPVPFDIDVCGTQVDITIVMLALEGQGGLTLATDDVIKPTKTVEPAYVESAYVEPYTYTIHLEQLSVDLEPLERVIDILPKDFGADAYKPSTSYLTLEGQAPILLDDPFVGTSAGYTFLIWPGPDWDSTFEDEMWEFEPREVKKLSFDVREYSGNNLKTDEVYCNWVVLKPWNTLSGPQAPISVGLPDNPGICSANDDSIVVDMTSHPSLIMPGEPTPVLYTVSITNNYDEPRFIEKIVDFLPPGFQYIVETTVSGFTTLDPYWIDDDEVPWEERVERPINGALREHLQWQSTPHFGGSDVKIEAHDTLVMEFQALATEDVSGNYYNELLVILRDTGIPGVFKHAYVDVDPSEYTSTYSWQQGMVTVPYYDSEADADGTTIDANLSIIDGGAGAIFTSWQVH